MKVGFVSLGCSKNLIDTEMAVGLFKKNKFEIVNTVQDAEIIVINTCGFIESAKEEAINTILEMAEYKNIGKCKYLVVMGCLVQRYKEELQKSIPEVDLFISISEYKEFWNKILNLIKKEDNTNICNNLEYMDRVISTGNKTAYLKIAEGCSNKCTYCAIPYIRGPFVSRKMEDIINEAKMLAKKGIKEIIVIAQDTTKYGIDIYGEPKLAKLLQEISKIKEIKWIHFLYSYPEGITDELIETVASNKKISKYFDIPIQHISDNVLKRMNRKTNKKQITELLEKIRSKIPDVTLRTSLIVGFPGETKEEFEELKEFIKTAKFDKLGTFMYSKEEGTPAEKLPNQIHGNTKKSRYNQIMAEQKEISEEIQKSKIGKEYEVLIEDKSFDGKYLIGRTMQDVPEIDGLVYIKNEKNQDLVNQFVKCKIIETNEYDLIGQLGTGTV